MATAISTDRRTARALIWRWLLSLLLVVGMTAGRAAPANAREMGCVGMTMHMPVQAAPPAHHRLPAVGGACCQLACCPAVLPASPCLGIAADSASVTYARPCGGGSGIVTALDPDPPRPPAL